jgi:hypothetical protein
MSAVAFHIRSFTNASCSAAQKDYYQNDNIIMSTISYVFVFIHVSLAYPLGSHNIILRTRAGVNFSDYFSSHSIAMLSQSGPCSQISFERDTFNTAALSAEVTPPCDTTRTSIEQLMSPRSYSMKKQRVMNVANKSNMLGEISPAERADISYVV